MGKRSVLAKATLEGSTVLSVVETSTGVLTSVVDPDDPATRLVHLQTVSEDKRINSHIRDDRNGGRQYVTIPPMSRRRFVRWAKRLVPFIHHYRRTSFALRPSPEYAAEIAPFLGMSGPRREPISLEALADAEARLNFEDPKQWVRITVASLAADRAWGVRVERGRIFVILPDQHGLMLKIPLEAGLKVTVGLMELAGVGIGPYLAYLDGRRPAGSVTTRRPAVPPDPPPAR